MKYQLLLFFVFSLLALAGCKDDYGYYNGMGKSPRYISASQLSDIGNTPPQEIENAGVIYLLNDYLFMVEQKKGIHIFEVSDTTNPVNLTFIKIPAVNDFTISGNVLYADNGPNMISIDISNIFQVQLIGTVENAFQPIMFPSLYEGPFECVNPQRGVVIEWVDTLLVDAKCNTN